MTRITRMEGLTEPFRESRSQRKGPNRFVIPSCLDLGHLRRNDGGMGQTRGASSVFAYSPIEHFFAIRWMVQGMADHTSPTAVFIDAKSSLVEKISWVFEQFPDA
jgi:hypothetical protein